MKKAGYTNYSSVQANSIILSNRCVSVGGNYYNPNNLNDRFFGVSIEDTSIGDGITCVINGIATIELAETVNKGQKIVSDINGKGVKFHNVGQYIGIALESGNNGDIIQILIQAGAGVDELISNEIKGLINNYINRDIITIETGDCIDSTRTEYIKVLFTLIVDIRLSGAGGLDTGVQLRNHWYYVYVIKNSNTGQVNGLLSLHPYNPTMPIGYDKKRMIGAIRNNNFFDIIPFRQVGTHNERTYYYNDRVYSGLIVLSNGNAISWTDIAIEPLATPEAKEAIIWAEVVNVNTSEQLYVKPENMPANDGYLQLKSVGQTATIRIPCYRTKWLSYYVRGAARANISVLGFVLEV